MKIFLRIALVLTLFLLNSSISQASTADYIPHKMLVKLVEDFSTTNPPKNFWIEINDNYNFSNIKPIEKGTRVYLETVKTTQEKIGKQDASLQARILKIYIPSSDTTLDINNPKAIIKLSKYEKVDTTDTVLDTGISVTNIFVKNITYPAQFVRGVAQNKEDNFLKSGVEQVYKSSPISYIEKGKPMNLKAGELATLTFYSKIKNQK